MTDKATDTMSDHAERIERHGSAEPFATADKHGVWPTCFAYMRGRDPSIEEILGVRALMVRSCQINRLHLACIFHDLDVEPTSLDYPGFWEFNAAIDAVPTHTVLIADLEFVREVSPVLVTIATGLETLHPHLRVHSYVQPEARALVAQYGK